MNNSPIICSKKHINQISDTLMKSFHNYPLLKVLIKDEATRNKFYPVMLKIIIKDVLKYGEIYTTSEEFEGVALWLPGKKSDMGLLRFILSGGIKSIFILGKKKANYIMKLANFIQKKKLENIESDNYYYLNFLGVKPKHQNKGYGSKLIKSFLKKLDEQNLACYLETFHPQNRKLYKRFGFELKETTPLLDTGIEQYCMLREPDKK